MNKSLLILMIVAFLCNAAWAQESNVINTDRPGYSNTPTTVPHKALQLESGWREDMFTNSSLSYRTFPELLLKYGLTERMELRLWQSFRSMNFILNSGTFFPPRQQTQNLSGPLPPAIGLKYRLAQTNEGKRIWSAMGELQINDAGSGLFLPSPGKYNPVDISLRLLHYRKFSNRYALLHNSIYNSFGQDLSFTFNNLFQVNERSTLFVEAVPGIYLNRLTSNNAYFLNTDAGAIYQLKRNVQFDASFGVSFPTTEVPYNLFLIPNFNQTVRAQPWFFALGFSVLMD